MTTGEKLAMLRKRKNITQEQLAEILGVSRLDGKKHMAAGISADSCVSFIRECGYFFLATSVADCPRLRPFGTV